MQIFALGSKEIGLANEKKGAIFLTNYQTNLYARKKNVLA